MDEELAGLSRPERLTRYRALVSEFTRRAQDARHKSIRNAYEILAAQWNRLAEELETDTDG